MALELCVTESYEALSLRAAEVIGDEIARSPNIVVLAATGRTPLQAYKHLGDACDSAAFDTTRMTVVQLDEYVGVAADDRRALIGWSKRVLIDPLHVDDGRVVSFHGADGDPEERCRTYDATIKARGGVDLAILGLGPNGHLGFNEPPSRPSDTTRIVRLTEASIESNASYWGSVDDVPTHAMTAGMDVILAARRILLLVSGSHKREILRRTLDGEATPDVPASYLREAANVTVIADRDAWPGDDLETTAAAETAIDVLA